MFQQHRQRPGVLEFVDTLGEAYLSRTFAEYLGLVGLHRIVTLPCHPRTNGKIERYGGTVKEQVKLGAYQTHSALQRALG